MRKIFNETVKKLENKERISEMRLLYDTTTAKKENKSKDKQLSMQCIFQKTLCWKEFKKSAMILVPEDLETF